MGRLEAPPLGLLGRPCGATLPGPVVDGKREGKERKKRKEKKKKNGRWVGTGGSGMVGERGLYENRNEGSGVWRFFNYLNSMDWGGWGNSASLFIIANQR